MWLAVLAMTMHVCSSSTSVTSPSPRPQLLVRVKPDAGALDKASMTDVFAEARAIWKRYVDIEFTTDDRQSDAGFDEQLTLDLQRQPLRRSDADSIGLGAIEFQAPDRPAHLITVSVAAAEMMAAGATWAGRSFDGLPQRVHDAFLARVLGRSVAHEIGHFLLRSPAHAHEGLMRPQFTVAELMDVRLSRYQLEPAQVLALERWIDARVPRPALVALLNGSMRPASDARAAADFEIRSAMAICASSSSARPCNGC
jgi:hypothetical protein